MEINQTNRTDNISSVRIPQKYYKEIYQDNISYIIRKGFHLTEFEDCIIESLNKLVIQYENCLNKEILLPSDHSLSIFEKEIRTLINILINLFFNEQNLKRKIVSNTISQIFQKIPALSEMIFQESIAPKINFISTNMFIIETTIPLHPKN